MISEGHHDERCQSAVAGRSMVCAEKDDLLIDPGIMAIVNTE